MKSKPEFKKQNPAAHPKKQTLQNEGVETEFSWVQSADFFRVLDNIEPQTSTESTHLKEFNSEF